MPGVAIASAATAIAAAKRRGGRGVGAVAPKSTKMMMMMATRRHRESRCRATGSSSSSSSKKDGEDGSVKSVEADAVIIDSGAKTVSSGDKSDEIKMLMDELASKDDFGKRGEGWFFVQVISALGILLAPRALEILLHDLGFVIFPVGLIILSVSVINLGFSNLSPFPAPRKAGELKTKGLYGLVRHPMYSGLLLAALGVCLIASSTARWFCFGALALVLERKMSFEEEILEDKFGDEYKKYVEKVPGRLFPSPSNFK